MEKRIYYNKDLMKKLAKNFKREKGFTFEDTFRFNHKQSDKHEIRIDDTDHFVFWCTNCQNEMNVFEIYHDIIRTSDENVDCIKFDAVCENCHTRAYRKIYTAGES